MANSVRYLTIEDVNDINTARSKAEYMHEMRGYSKPAYALALIADVYNQIYAKETQKAYEQDKDGLSAEVEARIDVLKTLTETKLFNQLDATFKRGGEFSLGFKNGMPDERALEFFSLTDPGYEFLSKTRTESVRLPETFACKEYSLSVVPEGERLTIDDRTFDTTLSPLEILRQEE